MARGHDANRIKRGASWHQDQCAKQADMLMVIQTSIWQLEDELEKLEQDIHLEWRFWENAYDDPYHILNMIEART